MLKASAVNVVVITAIPEIPGTSVFRSLVLCPNTDAIRNRKISGSMKLKNAALGLRQNSRRSKRNCLHVKAAVLMPGRRPPARR